MTYFLWLYIHKDSLRKQDLGNLMSFFQTITFLYSEFFMDKEKSLIHIYIFRAINTMQYIKKWPVLM